MRDWLSPAVIEVLGYVAATLTTVAFVPQVVQIWGTRTTAAGLSLAMLLTFTAGVAMWLAYGIALGSMPIIAANICTLVLNVLLIALKIQHGRR